MEPLLIKTYSQVGGDLPYFVGKQYGTGWLSTIAKYAFPILKRLFNVATHTAQDVLVNEKPVLPSLKEHAISEVKDTIKRGLGKKITRKRGRSMSVPPIFASPSNIKKRKRKRRRRK